MVFSKRSGQNKHGCFHSLWAPQPFSVCSPLHFLLWPQQSAALFLFPWSSISSRPATEPSPPQLYLTVTPAGSGEQPDCPSLRPLSTAAYFRWGSPWSEFPREMDERTVPKWCIRRHLDIRTITTSLVWHWKGFPLQLCDAVSRRRRSAFLGRVALQEAKWQMALLSQQVTACAYSSPACPCRGSLPKVTASEKPLRPTLAFSVLLGKGAVTPWCLSTTKVGLRRGGTLWFPHQVSMLTAVLCNALQLWFHTTAWPVAIPA